MFISPPDSTIHLPKLTNVAEPCNVFKASRKSREKMELLPLSASGYPVQGKIVLHRHLYSRRSASHGYCTVWDWELHLGWATCTSWKVTRATRAEQCTTVLARKKETGGQSETISLLNFILARVWLPWAWWIMCACVHRWTKNTLRNTQNHL